MSFTNLSTAQLLAHQYLVLQHTFSCINSNPTVIISFFPLFQHCLRRVENVNVFWN